MVVYSEQTDPLSNHKPNITKQNRTPNNEWTPSAIHYNEILTVSTANRKITHCMSHKYFFSKFVPFLEIMWKNTVETGRPQMTIWRTLIACWIHKATNTHSEYVTLTAFPLQQWLHERLSMLRYMYIACVVIT